MGLLGMQFHLFENECKSFSSREPYNVHTADPAKVPAAHGDRSYGGNSTNTVVTSLSADYPHGITILSPFGSDKKQVLNFCAQSAEELLKFLEDLKESIAEVSEMEQIRIECERRSS